VSFSIAKCIINALNASRSKVELSLTKSLQRASNIVIRILSKSTEIPLTAIHGPPGTGKTTVYVYSISEHLYDEKASLDTLNKNILYVSSINRLIQDVFTRVLQRFFSLGIIDVHDKQSLVKSLASIRILGSQIIPFASSDEVRDLYKLLGGVISESDLKNLLRLMTRREGKESIHIVFTTEWQSTPISLNRDTFILVDEASKSPMFHAFTPIARELLRSSATHFHELRLYGLSVIGDVQQAISLEPEYSSLRGRELLLLPYIERIIDNACKSGIVRNCDEYKLMLQETLRLPKLSEDPISYGYYEGQLKAIYTLGQKIGVDIISAIIECLNIAHRRIKSSGFLDQRLNRILSEYVEKAEAILESYKVFSPNPLPPLVVIDTERYRYEHGKEVEPHRIVIASIIALLLAYMLSCLYREKQVAFTLAVVAPYIELVNTIYQSFRYLKSQLQVDLNIIESLVQFSTTHAFLGGEADFVIAVLGREYYPSLYYPSIYFKEPELLNVQLSRHKLMLTVIGSIGYFYHSAHQFNIDKRNEEPRLATTLQQLINLVERHSLRIFYTDRRTRRS
jgi:hypothetical protein